MMKTIFSIFLALLLPFLNLLPNLYPLALVSQTLQIPNPSVSAEAEAVTRALVLGYDRFVTLPDISPCSAHNAAVMTALLTDSGVYSVVRRVNTPGTVAGLRALIRSTFRDAKAADTSVFYLSTHGISWEESGEIRLALMLSDGAKEETLSPAALKSMLDEIPGRKVLIVDACHSGALRGAFSDPDYVLLLSSAPEEESYFWRGESDTGAGYFTAALETALRFSDSALIDASGDGFVSPDELSARLSALYGASTACFTADASPLFRLPPAGESAEGLQNLTFEEARREGDALILPLRFTTLSPVRLEYRIVRKKDGAWDFDHAAVVPDQERTGTTRGLLSPGDKERKIRVSPEKLGEAGEALLLVVSLRGIHGQVPVLEGTAVIGEEVAGRR